MQTVSRSSFTTVTTEGAILPADLLQRIVDGRSLEGLRPEDYHLAPTERLNEAISRSWNRLLGVWEGFDEQRKGLPEDDRGTTLTRERWLLILLQELGYGRLPFQGTIAIDGEDEESAKYPISHEYDRVPLHLITFRQPLDRADGERAEQFRRSPHSLLQEFLNRSDRHLWGIVSNGLRLRLLRDNVSFTRAAYLEFDLEAMMAGELYADFTLLWLTAHQSRLEGAPENCWLEKWSQEAAEQGTRALDSLRDGVQEAISILGRGFLAHGANGELREQLRSGALSTADYYRQLLRLVYRLIFLFVAEDRNLLLVQETEPEIRARYYGYYSLTRLRELAARRRSGPHPDLYRTLRLVMVLLREGYPALGLPGLGSYLFSERSTPSLDAAEIANETLLDAIRALAFTIENRVLRPVDYKNLGAEELGSVYESLLELHPELNVAAATFDLRTAAGSERKTTGSYYTPTSLINSLLDTALEPVVADRLKAATRRFKEGNGGVGSKGVRDEQDSIVSRFAGVAGGDEAGRDVLRGDTDVSSGRAVRDDVPDQTRGRFDSGQHRGGVRPGDTGRLHPLSADQPGVSEGSGDADAAFAAREFGDSADSAADSGAMQDRRRDAALLDSGTGEKGGVGSEGVGSEGVGSEGVEGSLTPPFPHSPTPPFPHSPTPSSLAAALEEAILSIKVVDPAAGSGHFLIAAANRLARHLARVRTGDEEPSPEASRLALRDVVRQCIYGVDINEMAVELCKVGLWLETLDPGKPLSFLEANIQCGNSLLGATPALLARGIPDEAFTPITGDDKAYCTEWKKRNREQRKGQLDMFARGVRPWERLGNFAQAMRALETMAGDTVADVARQQAAYERLVGESDYQFGKLWADAWVAAFVWRKRPEGKPAADGRDGWPYPITEQVFREIERSPHTQPKWLKDEIRRLAAEYQFFHWHLAFPQVFAPRDAQTSEVFKTSEVYDKDDVTGWEGGFDVVLGNPPWERIKLQEKEWFASRSPAIAGARNAAARRKLIKGLQKDDPALYAAFQADKRKAEGESHFTRNSSYYPLMGRGDINTYQLFAELARHVQDAAGRVGVIVPSGVATDATTQFYFQDIMAKAALVNLYDFENRKGLFPAVDSRMKFCLLTLTGRERPAAQGAQFVFFALDVADLRDAERRFTLSAAEIALLNPNTRTCPIFRSRRDAELTKAIYRRVPIFVNEGREDGNMWSVEIGRMFHTSDDSPLFIDHETDTSLRLYEAKCYWQFDHRYATWDLHEKDYRDVALTEKQEPDFLLRFRYNIEREKIPGKFHDRLAQWYLSFRKITNATNERTLVVSITPESGLLDSGNNIYISVATNAAYLISGLNSYIADYCARQKVGGSNMTVGLLSQMPVLSPNKFSESCPWYASSYHFFFLPRILELTYTAYDLRSFAQDCGYHGPPFRWDEDRRFLLRCELDAAYFHLYGIARDDVAYIMDTFPIVRRKDEAAFGEYRTKRVILEIYDEMAAVMQRSGGAEAQRSGYQTRLDPPPGHPDAAHPWDEEYLGPELPREKWWQDIESPSTVASQSSGASRHAPTAEAAVKEPVPTFTLKSPPAKPSPPETKKPAGSPQPSQPALVTDFTPPQGSRNQRLKQVMALGDRVKTNRQDAAAIAQLVAALGDSDDSIRWLAGSALGLLGGATVVHTLSAFLKQAETPKARQEALNTLKRIVDNPKEDEQVRQMAGEMLLRKE